MLGSGRSKRLFKDHVVQGIKVKGGYEGWPVQQSLLQRVILKGFG